MKAIILAGGKGTRLEPYTTFLPKPLMPIGNMPILDIIMRQLLYYGINDITLAVGYLSELIVAYCSNGTMTDLKKYNLKLTISREEIPLGTAGPIGLLSALDDTFLVMNGDLLTSMDYLSMWRYHKKHQAIGTIATFHREIQLDLGVIEFNTDNWVTNYVEKPSSIYKVSTGVYIFEPEVLKYIEPGKYLDLPQLILLLLENGERIKNYSYNDYWLDIGRHEDYKKAITEFETNRSKFLPGNFTGVN